MVRTYTDRHSYLRAVKRHLICPKEERTRLLDTASRAVDAFLEENPQADEAAWRRNLGTPEELAAELMQSSNLEAVNTSLRKHTRTIWIACVLFLVIVAIGSAIGYWCWIHRDYVEVKTTIITVEDENDLLPLPSFQIHDYTGGGD